MRFNPDETGPRHLIAAVEDAGFDAGLADVDRLDSCPFDS